jgi:hypothetical protein
MNYSIPDPRSHTIGGIFILILLALLALAFAAIRVTLSSHGYLAHGPEAEQTRNCIEQNGVKTFKGEL